MNRKQSITLQPSGDYPTFSDSSYASTLTFSCGPRRPINLNRAGGVDFSSEFHPELLVKHYLLPRSIPLHTLLSLCGSGVTSKVRFGPLTHPDPRENDAGMESSLPHHLHFSNDRYNEKEGDNIPFSENVHHGGHLECLPRWTCLPFVDSERVTATIG